LKGGKGDISGEKAENAARQSKVRAVGKDK